MSRGLALGIFVLASIAGAVAWPSLAPAEQGAPSANAPLASAPSASASAASAPPASAPADDDKPIDGDAIPSEKSKSPKAAEWTSAPRVKLTRRGPAAATCRAQLVREWLRIRCEGQVFAVSLVGGSSEGVAFWIGGTADEPFGEILTPVRRGDRRVFQLWAPGKDAAGMFAPKPMLAVQEQWIEGQKSPIVTAW